MDYIYKGGSEWMMTIFNSIIFILFLHFIQINNLKGLKFSRNCKTNWKLIKMKKKNIKDKKNKIHKKN